MSKVHEAYQSLLKHSEKREQLEKAARAKLQAVILNLSDANKVGRKIWENFLSDVILWLPKNYINTTKSNFDFEF
jgi:hypothetical protein